MHIDLLYKVVPVCIGMNGCATGDVPKRIFGSNRSRRKSIAYFSDLLKNDEEIGARAAKYL